MTTMHSLLPNIICDKHNNNNNTCEFVKFVIKTKPLATRLTLDASSEREVEYKITMLYCMTEIDRKWVFMGEIMLFFVLNSSC